MSYFNYHSIRMQVLKEISTNYIFLLCLQFVCFNSIARSQNKNISFSFYQDTTSTLDFQAVSAANFDSNFKPLQSDLIWHKEAKFPVWIRFKPSNSIGEQKFLELSDTRFPEIEYHIPYANKYKRYLTGYGYPFNTRPILTDHYIFPIGEEQWHYLKIRASTFLHVKLQVHSSEKVIQEASKRNFLHSLYLGIMVITILGVSFFIYMIRHYSYFFYIGYVLSVSFVTLIERGYFFELLWPNTPILNFYFPIPIFGITIFLLLFLKNVWTLNKRSVRYLYRFMWVITFLIFPYVIYLLINKRYPEANNISIQFSSLFTFVAIVNGLISHFFAAGSQKFSIKLINIGLCTYCASGIVFILKMKNILPINFLTDNAMIFGSIVEVCFFSTAVVRQSDEIHKVQRQKIAGQKTHG